MRWNSESTSCLSSKWEEGGGRSDVAFKSSSPTLTVQSAAANLHFNMVHNNKVSNEFENGIFEYNKKCVPHVIVLISLEQKLVLTLHGLVANTCSY